MTLNLTYDRAVAIFKAADVVWSEDETLSEEWDELLREVKACYPSLAKEYAWL